MASFKELLKEVENGNRTGHKGGAWFPHKSAEGGTRTLAYGHKLSAEEEKGNYVVLPDGTVIDFDNRGLTDQEADQLLSSDWQKHKKVAESQWNSTQKTEFSSLNPMHQALLSEIAFNIGTLKSGKKFGWPSLAKGILNNDTEVVKEEIMRSFTDSKGNKKPLTNRVNKIRAFVDQFETDPTSVTIEGIDMGQPTQAPKTASSPMVDELVRQLQAMAKPAPMASQGPSRGRTDTTTADSGWSVQDEAAITEIGELMSETDMRDARVRAGERRLQQTFDEVVEDKEPKKWSKKDERAISEIDKLMSSRAATKEPKPTQESVEREPDASKDPIFGIF